MSETILLIEDNENILTINRKALLLEGFQVKEARTLSEAAEQWQQNRIDLIILDIMLPDGSGLDFCRELRTSNIVPILFLTALDEKEHLLEGLKAGGDDYLSKPYDLDILIAHVRSLLRRVALDKQSHLLAFGPLELDVISAQAYLYGQDMLLTQKEFSLLFMLVKNEGRVISKEEVFQVVWGQPMADDSKALYTCISRLKRKLEPAKESGLLLETKRNEGYVFTFQAEG